MTAPAHACPGCGAHGVPQHMLSCKPCWFALPKAIRDDVTITHRRREYAPGPHRRAVTAALLWYRDSKDGA